MKMHKQTHKYSVRRCIKELEKYSELIDIDRMRSVVPGMVDSGLLVVGFITMVKSR